MTQQLIPVYRSPEQEQLTGGAGISETRIGAIRGGDRIQTARFNVTGVVGLAVASNPNRRTVTVKNEGANDIFIGGEDLNVSNGYRLGSGDPITLELAGELWAITAGTTEALYILGEYDA